MTDTVEKVVSDPPKRNNRIRTASYLNRNCVRGRDLESMLRIRGCKIVFQQNWPKADLRSRRFCTRLSGGKFGFHITAQNGFAERLIGSIRRECVDHFIVLGEAHLRHILRTYARYYNDIRTHRSLDKDAPVSRPGGSDQLIHTRS